MTELIIHPIYALTSLCDENPFDLTLLPFEICEGVYVEDLSSLITERTFSWVRNEMGRRELEQLSNIKFALVRRQESSSSYIIVRDGGDLLIEPVEVVMACLRLIRPMRENLGLMRGELLSDGTLNVKQFKHPYHIMNVPEVEKLFSFRTEDALRLRALSPVMLEAMRGDFWKFRMAAQFYQAGYFQDSFWKTRFFLRCSAIEALYNSEIYRRSAVSKQRIAEFLGKDTCIYEDGDIPSYLQQAKDITIGKVLEPLYEIRHAIAHGNKIPEAMFRTTWRAGVNGRVNVVSVLDEAAGFIVRKSLCKVMADGLVEHFIDSATVDNFFGVQT